MKLAYVTIKKNNLKIFGINKAKTLVDFVSTEKDVQKGNTRMPLALSRNHEEDLMSEKDVEKAKVEMKMSGMSIESPSNNSKGDDLLANIEFKQQMIFKKQNTLQKAEFFEREPSNKKERGVSVYCRRKLP